MGSAGGGSPGERPLRDHPEDSHGRSPRGGRVDGFPGIFCRGSPGVCHMKGFPGGFPDRGPQEGVQWRVPPGVPKDRVPWMASLEGVP
jgi:hypothetical protein